MVCFISIGYVVNTLHSRIQTSGLSDISVKSELNPVRGRFVSQCVMKNEIALMHEQESHLHLELLLNSVSNPLNSLSEFESFVNQICETQVLRNDTFRLKKQWHSVIFQNQSELQKLQDEITQCRCVLDDVYSVECQEIEQLKLDFHRAKQRRNGLELYLSSNRCPESDRDQTRQKIYQAKDQVKESQKKLSALVSDCAPYCNWLCACLKLESARKQLGLVELEQQIKVSQTVRGRNFSNSGKRVEIKAGNALEQLAHSRFGEDAIVLRNVRLGMVSGEFDALIVTPCENQLVVQLAIEIKSNPNDIGGSFSKYCSALSWLSGGLSEQENEKYKNRHHRDGIFHQFTHYDVMMKQHFQLTSESFGFFLGEGTDFDRICVERIAFLTYLSPIHGFNSNTFAKLVSKCSQLHIVGVEHVYHYAQSLIDTESSEFSTQNILQLYSNNSAAHNIVLLNAPNVSAL